MVFLHYVSMIAYWVAAGLCLAAIGYCIMIVVDKSGVTEEERHLLVVALICGLGTLVIACGMSVIHTSTYKPVVITVQGPVSHDTLHVYDTIVKWSKQKYTGAVVTASKNAAEAKKKTAKFLEIYDAQ